MNSYPIELLTQLAPVMFVAGLDVPNSPDTLDTPQSPRGQDSFSQLVQRLRDALVNQRKPAIWQPDKSKTFQVVIVDKDVRFPPRKLLPPEDPGYSSSHSPLSPLTPSSPLHPDGLIAPIWVRKHTTLVPSVFVLFKRLYESPPHNPRSPLDLPDPERDREREQDERRNDTELAAEVALRKRSTNERGMKLTVVLLASRKILDDPSLDTRLTFIRRQSGLDSRAALFVLSPVSQAELGEFIVSLQQALYEPALEYYTSHSKRVRRKRNRHSQAVSSYPNPVGPLGNGNSSRPLRPEGWTVRYEYKMACFAEFRGEDEVALKHFQDAYEALVIMFGSTIILPPRTKRWAEAKVLADCINIKITKLYLYNNENALALSHHTTHMRRFGDFSRGWGIGEDTYEYWSWMARQYRVLAELIEHGTRSTLVIPIHKPIVSASSLNSATAMASGIPRVASPGMEVDAVRSLGINPNHALQHPGFYYYMAGKCTESRREKFNAALEADRRGETGVSASPGFVNEKKVDHSVLILELYTKSYEIFKKYAEGGSQSQQGRLPLYIAYRIAQTYQDSGKIDMAIRFFERIAKTYRREQWGSLLGPLLSTWYRCAVHLDEVELSVRLLIELLSHGANASYDSESLYNDLLDIFKTKAPPTDPIVIDNSESRPIFDTSLVFWKPEVRVGEPAGFQLSLSAPTDVSILSLSFSRLEIYVKEDSAPIIVNHVDAFEELPSVQRVDLGLIDESRSERTFEATLRWKPGGSLVFTGTTLSNVPATLSLSHLKLYLEYDPWKIEIPLEPCKSRDDSVALAPRWLSSLSPVRYIPVNRDDHSSVNVRHRPHKIDISVTHQSPAYLNEVYPLTIQVTNADDKELEVIIDVLLLPTELDNASNTITIDDEQSSGLIKGVSLGSLDPGASASKILHIVGTGAPGDRTVDVSVQSRSPTAHRESQDDESQPELLDITETLQTVVVPTTEPFKMVCDVIYRRAVRPQPGLADLRSFESDFWDDGDGGVAEVRSAFRCNGPWTLEIQSLVLNKQDGTQAKILTSSMDDIGDDIFPSDYYEGDEFGDVCSISIVLQAEDGHLAPLLSVPVPGEYEVAWRRKAPSGEFGGRVITSFVLPPLQPPLDGLVGLLDIPSIAKLHEPTTMSLTIRNRHPTRSSNIVVQLDPEPTDAFIVSGLRNGRVPVMLPGAEEKLVWRLIPVECGYVKPPNIRVLDRRNAIASSQGLGGPGAEVQTEGVPVKLVDIRTEQKILSLNPVGDGEESAVMGGSKLDEANPIANVLVLP
ncbi:hypothetical protein AAF712_000337 [Marasmius tenuissimus]|uniref:Trafficking protein particle complex subunit 11 n=1 Tax=Marasmius tenuissimus TaxID=585030 RepID=A0ABR3AGW9_9AGAR